jgi:class 3 adenylate cyclase/mannose-6-phosphate isomerase-like protein (cupin superfamily)
MSEIKARRFDEPDEVVTLPGLTGRIVALGEAYVGRFVHEPGWCWSKDVKPIVGTSSCQYHHQGFVVSGRAQVTTDDGARRTIGPGEVFDIPPGHDAWVLGDEPFISIEFRGARDWARPTIAGERVLATLMLTDIVGSTALAARMGDVAWKTLLARHSDRARLELDRFRGHEVTTTGDGLLALFDGPARAVRCAAAIARAARADGIEIRAGVHAGEVERHTDNVRGVAVHAVARVASLAGPGEVLVSGSTVALLEGSGLSFADAGEHELKGLPGPRRLYRLAGDDAA